MAIQKLISDVHNGGLRVRGVTKGLLITKPIPVRDWATMPHPTAAYAAAILKVAKSDETHAVLDALATASLPKSVADAIGAPPLSTHAARLAIKDRAESPNGFAVVQWKDKNGRQITVKAEGAILTHAGEPSRASPVVLRMLQAVASYNASQGAEPLERIAAFMPLQSVIKDVTGREFATDEYLDTLTIHQAGAIAIDMSQTADGLVFDAVLMEKRAASSDADDADAPEDGDEPPRTKREQSEGFLLSPAQQESFAKQTRTSTRAKKAYSIGKNAYVVLSPEVEIGLRVINSQKLATPEERRIFAQNPRKAIAQAIEDASLSTNAESIAEAVFVETKQYSDRVVDYGIWEKPLPPAPGRSPVKDGPEGGMLGGVEFGPRVMPVANAVSGSSRGEAGPVSMLLTKTNTKEVTYRSPHAPRTPDCPPVASNADLRSATPKAHQAIGIQWLIDAWTQGHPGVLLADDMGLGKTFQALAFAAWLRRADARRRRGPIMVIAPTSLLKNWIKEADKYLAPGTLGEPLRAFGSGIAALKRAARDAGKGDTIDVDALRSADWILTTYETMADNHLAFSKVPASLVVFDEIQKIKDPATINTATALTINADFLLALTGTPVENRMEDLWTIMDRVWAGYLGSLKDFSATYGSAEEEPLKALKDTLDKPTKFGVPVMLRRMKKDHIEGLPNRTFIPYETRMPDRQASAYDGILADAKGMDRAKGAALRIVQQMGSVSMHPSKEIIDPYDAKRASDWIEASARTAATWRILQDIQARGEKAIVFIDSHHIQTIFTGVMATLFKMKQEPFTINGSVPGDKRQDMVDAFEARGRGFDLMALSPRAAGVGLTIIQANHVIHLSR